MDISLIVCTRDRAHALERMLATLEQLVFAGSWEAVLVDNGSVDQTAQVLRRFANNTRLNVRLAFEGKKGLASARNCGIRHSCGSVLAFTDDDCYPDPGFLTAIAKRLSDPTVSFCGGQVLLFDPADRPVTIQARKEPLAILGGQFLKSGLIHGANMAVKRCSLLRVRGFDERLGAGTFFKSGEDTDLLRRLAWSGENGFFDPDIRVRHHHGRNTIAQEMALRKGYQRGIGAGLAKFALYQETRWVALRSFFWQMRGAPLWRKMRLLIFAAEFSRRVGFSSKTAWEHPSSLS